jgi:hypothetical protein
MPDRLRRAAEAAKHAPASEKTLEQITELNKLARAVFTRSYNDNKPGVAVSALRELRKIVELEGHLLGRRKGGSTTNVVNVTLTRDQAAGMAEILLQRHRAKAIETTAASGEASTTAFVDSKKSEDGK